MFYGSLGFGCITNLFEFTCMGTSSFLSAMLSKGNNVFDVLFAYLKDEVVPKTGLLLNERIYFDGSKILFFLR